MSRKILWAIASLLFIAIACDKDDDETVELPQGFILGKWQISLSSGIKYPYFEEGDVFYFEDEEKIDVISKMVLKEKYILDHSDLTLEFQSAALSPLGKFDIKTTSEKQIKLVPRMYKGELSLLLKKLEMPEVSDILGKWKVTSLNSFQLKDNRMLRNSVYDNMSPSDQDDIYEFLKNDKGILWEDANIKKDIILSYLLKKNTLLLKMSQNNIVQEKAINLLTMEENTIQGKWTEVNSDYEVITYHITFSRV